MTADRTIPAMLLTLFLVICIPAGLYYRKLPAPALSPAEVELAKFTSQPVAISAPQPSQLFSGLVAPVTPPRLKAEVDTGDKAAKSAPPPAGTAKNVKPAPARSLGSLPVVSMISYDSSTKTAIIDNRVVTEGSDLDGGKIVRIEENRVLMRKAGRNIWLTIE